ncbi:PHB depolymerase family esterase [Burkholderia metallica]|uniref:PHB depolymerase family esterase n=1 Tax=Burkholderia metallica TaxID=488729 RepID=UPI001FC8A207|nr:PHB depolymerase family esterase [Burkholderia metallica]
MRRTATPRTKPASRKRPALSNDGVWACSFFSSLPAPGRFVNHVTCSLYRPRGAPRHGPLVVMLDGCQQAAESFALGTRVAPDAAYSAPISRRSTEWPRGTIRLAATAVRRERTSGRWLRPLVPSRH